LTRMICGLFDCEGEEEDEKAHEIEMLLGRNQLPDELLTKLVKECMLPYELMWRKSVASSFLSLRGRILLFDSLCLSRCLSLTISVSLCLSLILISVSLSLSLSHSLSLSLSVSLSNPPQSV
jgi:hypothetical protein